MSLVTEEKRERNRKYQAKWYQANKLVHKERTSLNNARARKVNRTYIREYLTKHPCIDCGNNDTRVLEFDHRDPQTKKASVSNLVQQAHSLATIKREIAKCDIRCANCHRIRTITQREMGEF